MTLEEKREACLAELLAAIKRILNHSKTLNEAKWSATAALWVITEITEKGRIPSTEETIEWLREREAEFETRRRATLN